VRTPRDAAPASLFPIALVSGLVYLVNSRRAYAVACDRLGTGARLVAVLGAAGTVGLGLVLIAVG